jgi:uncharacterized membrane protein
MNKIFISAIFISFIATGMSCSKSNDGGGGTTVDCNTVSNKAFAADVSPIIQSRCAITGCHDAASTNSGGPLTGYSQIFNKRSNIRSEVSSGRMPQGSSLTDAQKNSIICWIDSGAPNN